MSGPARGGAAQSGMTLVEVLLVLALITIASYTFTNWINKTRQQTERQVAASEMLQRDLRTITNLRAGLQGCAELIMNYGVGDNTGDAMLPLHSLVVDSVIASTVKSASNPIPAPGPVGFSGWATVSVTGQVDMNGPLDANAIVWGDEIMYVAELNPVTFTAYYSESGSTWSPAGVGTGTSTNAEIVSIDRLQFVYDYLTWDTRTAVAGSGEGLRLVEWRSQPVIEYSSLNGLTDTPSVYPGVSTCCPRLMASCQYLTSTGYTLAYNPANATLTAACSSCFYSLTPEADVANDIPISSPGDLAMGSWAYLDDFDEIASFSAKPGVNLGRIARANGGAGGQEAGSASYSIALNATGQSTSTTVVGLQGDGVPLMVPAYAVLNYAIPESLGGGGGIGFPAGFEVAVAGQANSREIYLRLVYLASNGGTYSPGTFQALSETSEISVDPLFDF
jgi:prepilin-type N-terminal cleavage/methylation domain-containing protein